MTPQLHCIKIINLSSFIRFQLRNGFMKIKFCVALYMIYVMYRNDRLGLQ